MENKNYENFDKLAEKLMCDVSPESAPTDFTSRIMTEVYSIQKKKFYSYKPAISKRGWMVIFIMTGSLVTWLLFSDNSMDTTSGMSQSWIYLNNLLGPFIRFRFSDVTAGILLSASVMLFIQIILLHHYLNKRFYK
jgi:hypothetical protein